MTQRERSMLLVAGAIGGFVLLFGGFMAVTKALDSLGEKDRQIAALRQEVDIQDMRQINLVKTQAKHEQWRAISLPADQSLASQRYQAFLRELARKHGFFVKTLTDSGHLSTSSKAAAGAVTRLAFNLQLTDGTLPRLVAFLTDFYALNLPHSVRDMTLVRPANDTDGRLEITLKIEALSVPNAVNRDFLVALPGHPLLTIDVFTLLKGGPTGLALGPWLVSPTGIYGARKLASEHVADRDYRKLAGKNVFLGLQAARESDGGPSAEREMLRVVQLTSITANFLATEATLYNRRTGRFYTVRAEGGFDSFEIRDGNDQLLLKGTVKAITPRDVVFLTGDKYYAVHIGGFLEQAMKKELTTAELKDFGVTVADTAAAAAPEKEKPGEP